MRTRKFLLIGTACLTMMFLQGASNLLRGQTSMPAALTGQVTSIEEGPMEGVLVSAKRAGSTVAITVVTDKSGHYSFPSSKLEPGQYALTIRAVGYDLDGPGTVDVSQQKTASADLKLRKTKDLASQLTNAEWMMSIPGTDQQKMSANCTGCHTMQRIVKSTHDTDEFMQTVARMSGYAPGAVPLVPVRRIATREEIHPEKFRKQAEYLSTINLSSTPRWEYPLKTLPRPTGRSTRVLITEYDLPRRAAQPHDVILGPDGMAYYSDFGAQVLGRLDPKTGKVTEFAVPELKHGFPPGGLDIEADKDGNIWLGMMLQGGLAKFDTKTEKFQLYALPAKLNSDVAQQAMVVPSYNIDGKVWMNNVGFQGVHRMDLATGQFDTYALNNNPNSATAGGGMEGGSGHSPYGIAADSKNNLYVMDFSTENIGKIDAKTGKLTYYPTPTHDSRPRRGHMDAQDRLWFAEYAANKLAVFDTRTNEFKEWTLPTPWTEPYDVIQDKNGELWTGGMNSDRVVRMDLKTNQSVEYLLPKDTNIRRVFVDNSTTPVTFWAGSNHGGSIVKLEPLD